MTLFNQIEGWVILGVFTYLWIKGKNWYEDMQTKNSIQLSEIAKLEWEKKSLLREIQDLEAQIETQEDSYQEHEKKIDALMLEIQDHEEDYLKLWKALVTIYADNPDIKDMLEQSLKRSLAKD
jgi:peptidoglycan hydrolase CwlO-like protein